MPGIYQRYVESADYDELAATLTMVGHSGARADVRCERLCAIQTNLVASPWATVTLDGRRVPRRQLAVRPGALVTILAGRGAHQIEVQLGSLADSGDVLEHPLARCLVLGQRPGRPGQGPAKSSRPQLASAGIGCQSTLTDPCRRVACSSGPSTTSLAPLRSETLRFSDEPHTRRRRHGEAKDF